MTLAGPDPVDSAGTASSADDHAHASIPRLLLTAEEAATSLAISRSRVYELMRAGEIASVKLGGRRRIPFSDVTDFVERLRMNGDAPSSEPNARS